MRRSRLKGWMWVGLGPALFALNLLAPGSEGALPLGVGEALGCSGGGNLPAPPDGWTYLRPRLYSLSNPNAEIPVASDGFFVIQAETYHLDEAQAQLRVVVADEGGNEVPGDVSLLRQEPSGERQSFLFGWAARQPLAVGSRFTATLATEPAAVGDTSVGGQFALRVEGLSTVQAAPVATFHDWGRYWRGEPEGDSVQCALNQTSPPCGPPRTVSLPTRVREEVAAIVVWAPPDIVGGVAWNLRFEGAQVGADPGSDFFDRVEGFEPHADYGGDVGLFVAFPEPAERYCATMVIEDLRTGLEQRSELCAGPPLPLTAMFGSDTMLGSCAEPPTPELTQAWCELRQSTSPICSGDDAHLEPESSLVGCALSPAQPGPSALLSLAGLVSTWLVRRRGQRQSKKR